ncbi:MAG: hypothetical protein ACRCY8_09335 [Dermatophilaceae bacterium]
MSALADLLPDYDAREHHQVDLRCTPAEAVRLALSAPAAPDLLTATLLMARGLPRAATVADLFEQMGFQVLHRSPHEVVLGASGRPWRLAENVRAFDPASAGSVRMAVDLRAVETSTGCRLSTETRVAAVDERARRRFRRYWGAVGPFSALIRRRWLAAVVRTAR